MNNQCPCMKTLLMESILENPLGLNIFALDQDYRYLKFSKTHQEIMKHIWGVEIEEGCNMLDYICEQSDKIRAKNNFDRALYGEYFSIRENYGNDELQRSSWKNDYSPIYDENQEIIGVSVLVYDLTDIVKHEKILKISEIQQEIGRQRELFLNSIGDGLYGLDLDGNCFFINPSALKTLGFSENEIIGQNTHSLIHHHKSNGDLFLQNECIVHHSITKNIQISQRDWLFKKNGDIFPVEIIATPLVENETVYGTVISFRDITKQYTAEKTLKELNLKLENERDRYETIMEVASDGIHILDEEGNLIEFNLTFETMLGYSHDEMKKLNLAQWDNTLTEKQVVDIIQSLMAKPQIFETKHRRKDGSVYDVEISTKSIILNEKKYLYASSRDITQRKVDEQKILEQKIEFETIFNSSKDGIAITDLESKFINFNDAYLDMIGYTREELLTKSCLEITASEDKERSMNVISTLFEVGSIKNFQKTCIGKGGKRILGNLSISLLPDKNRILLVTKDVTALKIIEDQSRLASMGEMIGNIAHQWRQPLSVISTSATGLMVQNEFRLLDDEKLNRACENINMSAQYLSKTIDDFRNFIRGDKVFEQLKLIDIINGSLSIVASSLNSNYINLVLNIDDFFEIYGNKNELEQAFINIINNAKDVLIEKVLEEERILFLSTKKIDNETLEFVIRDNGGGIPLDIIDKIFEPYFTTKHQSQGTGLGLSIAHKIITERHNQILSVYNDEFEYNGKKYKGACFIIVFKNNEL